MSSINISQKSKGSTGFDRRKAALLWFATLAVILSAIYLAGLFMSDEAIRADFSKKALPPSFAHPFGTDYLGRDMFVRTIKGLAFSLKVGALASAVSAVIALAVGVIAAMGGGVIDHVVNAIIDTFMGIPHTVLIILISLALNRGAMGMLIGVAITHWCSLARVIRGEVLQIRGQHYIAASKAFGKSPAFIAARHMFPHVFPQFLVGLILLFPHAIMHEAGLTFLGFGMPPETPAIGIILSEAMRYVSTGSWWLTFFPGLSLVALVLMIESLGSTIRFMLEPKQAQL